MSSGLLKNSRGRRRRSRPRKLAAHTATWVLIATVGGAAAATAGGRSAAEMPSAVRQERALGRDILLDARHEAWSEPAPATFRARFATSRGDVIIAVQRDWAPVGADRFFNLVRHGFYDDTRVFRVRAGVFVQFGLSGDPAVNAVWYDRAIADDPPRQSNRRGRVFFAMRSPHDRTTQVVINLRDNADYDEQGFVPFGEVAEGMSVVDSLYSEYGERAGGGMRGGNQGRIVAAGNAHLDADFPLLDRILTAVIEPSRAAGPGF